MKNFFVFAFFVFLLTSKSVFASDSLSSSACDAAGNCAAELSKYKKEKEILCEGPPLKAWWSSKGNWSIISCSCLCSDQENANWFSMAGKPSRLLPYGAYIVPQYLLKNSAASVENVYDPKKLCEPLEINRLKKSDFVLSEHIYNGVGDNDFCYGIMYGNFSNRGVEIFEGGKVSLLENLKDSKSVNVSDQAALISLNEKLGIVVDDHNNSAYSRNGVIVSPRAYIYNFADQTGKSKSYLVEGDAVKLKAVSTQGDFAEFIYREKNGTIINKFIKNDELDNP